MATQTIFNAALQRDAEYDCQVDLNGDFVCTCAEDGSFLKFTEGTDLASAAALSGELNVGQEPITESKPAEPVVEPVAEPVLTV